MLIYDDFVPISCSQALTDEQKERIKGFSKECREATGVSEDLVMKARKGEFVDDPKLKNHLFCFAKKVGFMNEAGEVQKDVIKAKITPDVGNEEAVKVTEKCGSIKRDNPEQTTFDVLKCYFESTTKHIVLT